MTQEFSRHPAAPKAPREEKGDRGAEDVAREIQQEAPPQAEEQTAADREHAAGQEQHIARGVEQG